MWQTVDRSGKEPPTLLEKAIAMVKAWLPRFQLLDVDKFMNAYPHQLSGGQLQRLSLAAARSTNRIYSLRMKPLPPWIRIMKRPSSVWSNSCVREYGMAVLWITHNLPQALPLSEKVYIMDQGMMVENVSIDQFLQTNITQPPKPCWMLFITKCHHQKTEENPSNFRIHKKIWQSGGPEWFQSLHFMEASVWL